MMRSPFGGVLFMMRSHKPATVDTPYSSNLFRHRSVASSTRSRQRIDGSNGSFLYWSRGSRVRGSVSVDPWPTQVFIIHWSIDQDHRLSGANRTRQVKRFNLAERLFSSNMLNIQCIGAQTCRLWDNVLMDEEGWPDAIIRWI